MLNFERRGNPMPQIHIPETLFAEIEKMLPPSASAAEFVVQAVREKLSVEDRKREFYRISDQNRAAMTEKGISAAEILADFESVRGKLDG